MSQQIKLSSLPSANLTKLGGDEYFMVIQSGTNQKLSLANLFGNIKTPVTVNPSNADLDFLAKGASDNELFFIDASANNVGIGTIAPEQKLHVSGNLSVGSTTSDGVIVRSREVISHPVNQSVEDVLLSTSRAITQIELYGNSSYILPIGTDRQEKLIVLTQLDLAGQATVRVDGLTAPFNTIKMSKVGDSVSLIFLSGSWFATATNGAQLLTEI